MWADFSNNNCFSFGASSKNFNTLWLKQQRKVEETCMLLFGETDGMAFFPYVLISSYSGRGLKMPALRAKGISRAAALSQERCTSLSTWPRTLMFDLSYNREREWVNIDRVAKQHPSFVKAKLHIVRIYLIETVEHYLYIAENLTKANINSLRYFGVFLWLRSSRPADSFVQRVLQYLWPHLKFLFKRMQWNPGDMSMCFVSLSVS